MADTKTVTFDSQKLADIATKSREEAIEVFRDSGNYALDAIEYMFSLFLIKTAPPPAAQSAGQEAVAWPKKMTATSFRSPNDRHYQDGWNDCLCACKDAAPVNGGEREDLISKPAQVAGAVFRVGTKVATVVAAAQRNYEYRNSADGAAYPDSFTAAQIAEMDAVIPQRDRRFIDIRDYQALARERTCPGCEGKPAPQNNPCAVCGKRAADAPQVNGGETAYRKALEEIVGNDPFAQSSAGVIARAALSKARGEQV